MNCKDAIMMNWDGERSSINLFHGNIFALEEKKE
jgi:hypothetical protein